MVSKIRGIVLAPRFLLTGSSARKLRRGRANLLPGRLHTYRLGPLTASELGDDFDERLAMSTGTLPGIYAESVRDTLPFSVAEATSR